MQANELEVIGALYVPPKKVVIPVTLEISVTIENIRQTGDGNLAPLVCPICGILLVVLPFLAHTVTLRDSFGNCPQCNMMSPILDGTYGFSRYVKETLSRVSITREQAYAVLRSIEQARTDAELISNLRSINDTVASLAEIAVQKPDRRLLLKWLGALLVGLSAVDSGLAVYDWIEDRVMLDVKEKRLETSAPRKTPSKKPKIRIVQRGRMMCLTTSSR